MPSPLMLPADLDGPSLTMECGDSPVDDLEDIEPESPVVRSSLLSRLLRRG